MRWIRVMGTGSSTGALGLGQGVGSSSCWSQTGEPRAWLCSWGCSGPWQQQGTFVTFGEARTGGAGGVPSCHLCVRQMPGQGKREERVTNISGASEGLSSHTTCTCTKAQLCLSTRCPLGHEGQPQLTWHSAPGAPPLTHIGECLHCLSKGSVLWAACRHHPQARQHQL